MRTFHELSAAGFRGNGQKIAETLSKYAVFFKVKIAIHSGPCCIFGIVANECPVLHELLPTLPSLSYRTATSNTATIIKLAGTPSRFQLWVWDAVNAGSVAESLRVFSDNQTLEDSGPFDHAETLAGQAHVNAQHSETFTPQLLNYDLSGVVNFQKGCYTGQRWLPGCITGLKQKSACACCWLTARQTLNDGADIALVQRTSRLKLKSCTAPAEPVIRSPCWSYCPQPARIAKNPCCSSRIRKWD